MKNSNIREKDVEARLLREVKKRLSGAAYKYTSPSRRSVPDRIILWKFFDVAFDFHCGFVVFVECKRPGQTWTEAQARERDKLIRLGQKVYLVSTYEEVDELMGILELLT